MARGVRLVKRQVNFVWEQMPREEALATYEALMSVRVERCEMVIDLVRRQGYEAGFELDGIAEFNRFFLDRLPVYRGADLVNGTELIGDRWMSVIWDIGLLIGEAAIRRHPVLRWEFYEPGRKNIVGAHGPTIVARPKGDPVFPLMFLEGYAVAICHPGTIEVVRVKGFDVPLAPPPIRPDLFLIISATADRRVEEDLEEDV
ncbi:MAG: hypothetical protein DI534_08115 [Leifsonia xyli]|nr:MAG: hypothetical protein DI534_08115 [Leifsonia xyli]